MQEQPPPGLPLPSQGEGKSIHVVAGVIRDAKGRILLARRTQGRDLAGLWEFPGGKVEPGETPEDALTRELHEELGIEAVSGEAVIRVPQQYPDKRLVLDVRHVAFRGVPKGLDGQALVWAPLHRLVDYPMPPADRPVVAALLQPDRYLITPTPGADDAGWLAGLQAALAAGVRRVQLRAPGCAPARWAELAEQAVALCREADAEVLVNGDAGLAATLGIGLHLRALQLRDAAIAGSIESIRASGQPVAASCHDAEEQALAEQLGCSFAILGPLRETPTHPGQAGIGWQGFARLREQVSLPIYAIGGLGVGDIIEARAHGAQGIAAIRGLWNP
ncbi:MAG: Nudix family hydrolase [Thermomonas sp.]|uniref:Nudix family hydrolase n=1 Tax=Thermomonas sp. TaxID=1971895 RepID=UPI0039E3F44B